MRLVAVMHLLAVLRPRERWTESLLRRHPSRRSMLSYSAIPGGVPRRSVRTAG